MPLPLTNTVKTTCSYCGVGCGIIASQDRNGRLRVVGDPDHPVNSGLLCSKGKALHHVAQNKGDRLLYPQMRRSRAHPLERVDWDSALTRAAAVFRTTIDRFGPQSVGFYVSGQCLTEEYYIVNKLVKGFIGCNNIDTNSRLCMSTAVVGYKLALGDDAFPLSYDDIEKCSCFLITGANPAWCHPILFQRLEQHKLLNPHIKVIVVDPRRTQTCALADLHLQIHPGTDVALYNAIARVLIETGNIDRDFIENHTDGFEALRTAAMSMSLKEAAQSCGVKVEEICLAAQFIGESPTFQSWWAMGLNQSAMGVDKNLALLNLSLITGKIGKPGSGPFSLTGQPNAMGGREVGGLANLLAAHHDLDNAAHREKVSAYWGGGPISEQPGLTATEMFEALASGEMRAIWIICTNPAVSLPNSELTDRALKNARFVVVQDISTFSETIQYADMILPAAGWLEKNGTMTNSERRISLLEKMLEPPGEALPDVDILCKFAQHMGWGESFSYSNPSEIFDEHAALTRGTVIDICGLNHARFRKEGSFQWPCPTETHPGTPRLFEDAQFYTASKRAKLHGIEQRNDSEPLSEEFPLVLTTGRLRDQWHSMTKTGKVRKLSQQEDQPFVEIHPLDAQSLGLADGQPARMVSARAEITLSVRISESIKLGTVFVPMHFNAAFHGSAARANLLTSSRRDPKSKEPDLKYSAVSLFPIKQSPRKIVVIGGGAAALHFVTSYRAQNQSDSITVIGEEPEAFYNRVRLPEYLDGRSAWKELLTCDKERARAMGVNFINSSPITTIDRDKCSVTDVKGNSYPYDVLVLATGSRAMLPTDAPITKEGVHCLRNRHDAEAIRAQATPSARAIVLGGGLLGIEAADALTRCGVQVTLLHRSERLMGMQLDETASQLLCEKLSDQGIEVFLSETIKHVHGESRVIGVRTTNGRYLPCDLLLYAVGTRPNDELAKDAGLLCGEGVVVDDAMRSGDPNIYCIGEVAEHNSVRYGTTPAVQHQAGVAAAQINGNPWKLYRGSISINVLKVEGVALATLGESNRPLDTKGDVEEVVFLDLGQCTYMRCVVRHDVLIGAILLGDTSPLPHLKQLIEQGVELDGERSQLLRPGTGIEKIPLRGRVVCSCNQVGEGNIADAINGGCFSPEEVCAATRAGTGCGSCRSEVSQLFERYSILAPA